MGMPAKQLYGTRQPGCQINALTQALTVTVCVVEV